VPRAGFDCLFSAATTSISSIPRTSTIACLKDRPKSSLAEAAQEDARLAHVSGGLGWATSFIEAPQPMPATRHDVVEAPACWAVRHVSG
jgi:hypothetical protein